MPSCIFCNVKESDINISLVEEFLIVDK